MLQSNLQVVYSILKLDHICFSVYFINSLGNVEVLNIAWILDAQSVTVSAQLKFDYKIK